MIDFLPLNAIFRILVFVIYPIAISIIINRSNDEFMYIRLNHHLSSQRTVEAPPQFDQDRQYITFEEYVANGGQSDAAFSGVNKIGAGPAVKNQIELMEALTNFVIDFLYRVDESTLKLSLALTCMTVIGIMFSMNMRREHSSKAPRQRRIEFDDLSDTCVDQLYSELQQRFSNRNNKSEAMLEEIYHITLPSIVKEISMKMSVQLSGYQNLNEQFAAFIQAIDGQYSAINKKLNSLKSEHEIKITQLIKQFKDLKLNSAQYLQKLETFERNSQLPNDSMTSDTDISEPTVRSIEELRLLI